MAKPTWDGRTGFTTADWTSLSYVVVLVKPEMSITHFARKIHGITNDTVADAPVFEAIRDDVLAALDTDADTLKLARRLLPDAGSYQLGNLVEAFTLADELPDGLSPHRATYDALVAARLFVRLATLLDTHPLSLEELRGQPSGRGDDDAQALF